ncbi:hypothetical protein F4779DRAFT_619841 [Xylariaceae sp. FL0662B]|nr:hypothetical protein F4779DRAFT_619841 [Xylariaceae sp. FL0662B]
MAPVLRSLSPRAIFSPVPSPRRALPTLPVRSPSAPPTTRAFARPPTTTAVASTSSGTASDTAGPSYCAAPGSAGLAEAAARADAERQDDRQYMVGDRATRRNSARCGGACINRPRPSAPNSADLTVVVTERGLLSGAVAALHPANLPSAVALGTSTRPKPITSLPPRRRTGQPGWEKPWKTAMLSTRSPAAPALVPPRPSSPTWEGYCPAYRPPAAPGSTILADAAANAERMTIAQRATNGAVCGGAPHTIVFSIAAGPGREHYPSPTPPTPTHPRSSTWDGHLAPRSLLPALWASNFSALMPRRRPTTDLRRKRRIGEPGWANPSKTAMSPATSLAASPNRRAASSGRVFVRRGRGRREDGGCPGDRKGWKDEGKGKEKDLLQPAEEKNEEDDDEEMGGGQWSGWGEAMPPGMRERNKSWRRELFGTPLVPSGEDPEKKVRWAWRHWCGVSIIVLVSSLTSTDYISRASLVVNAIDEDQNLLLAGAFK